MPSRKLLSLARAEGGGSWQGRKALMAEEVVWSAVASQLTAAWGVCRAHLWPRAGVAVVSI